MPTVASALAEQLGCESTKFNLQIEWPIHLAYRTDRCEVKFFSFLVGLKSSLVGIFAGRLPCELQKNIPPVSHKKIAVWVYCRKFNAAALVSVFPSRLVENYCDMRNNNHNNEVFSLAVWVFCRDSSSSGCKPSLTSHVLLALACSLWAMLPDIPSQ